MSRYSIDLVASVSQKTSLSDGILLRPATIRHLSGVFLPPIRATTTSTGGPRGQIGDKQPRSRCSGTGNHSRLSTGVMVGSR